MLVYVQVVPGSLLEMTRGIMRSTFSSLIFKPVYTFLFDRSDQATSELLSKIEEAKKMNAVVVTNPTSIKSFVLKYIEILHLMELSKFKTAGSGAGMKLDQFKELQDSIEAKLVGVQGHWEDAAALMWSTDLKKMGFLPVRNDPEWNKLFDSKGNKLYGTKKSLLHGVWLKFQKPSNWNVDQMQVLSGLRQLDPFKGILKIFNEGVLLLDEVDLLLHPLKSELNWPLGVKEALDLTLPPKDSPGNDDGSRKWAGLRWQLSFHLIDAVLYCSRKRTTFDYSDNASATRVLVALFSAFESGLTERIVQGTPHLVLVDRQFYTKTLQSIFAQWILVWLADKGVSGLPQNSILAYIQNSSAAGKEILSAVKKSCSDHSLKLLNLCHTLLTSILPHVLGKIDRVGFGLLDDDYLASHRSEPVSRKLLAVPFIGKDVPSGQSEFSHPDVAIMLSVAAYRYEGLRKEDFAQLLKFNVSLVAREMGKLSERPSSVRWNSWVHLAGGRVRGVRKLPYISDGDTRVLPNSLHPGADPGHTNDGIDPDILNSIWPLHLIDYKDTEQFAVLYKLLHRLPQIVEWYLTNIVFPITMRFQLQRISASGQELGGDLVFGRRLGFSGTPSNLLPVELGECCFEEGDDGRILRTLTSPSISSVNVLSTGWSVRSVLDLIATADPPYHALVDTGALVTGYDNLAVAQYLLQHGLAGFDACIFLDAQDRKMALMRVGMIVIRMDQCGVPLNKRFTFYDQTHTTGMDIKQHFTARAAVTLGKDMTFRDLAQGAYRCIERLSARLSRILMRLGLIKN
jgi:hypothetical protein